MKGGTEETGLIESDFPTDCQLERTEERTPPEQTIFVIVVVIVFLLVRSCLLITMKNVS